jgi:hypothetical protein
MPYTIRRGGGPRPWKIIKKTTGEVVGTSKTREQAEASVRARYMGENKKKVK